MSQNKNSLLRIVHGGVIASLYILLLFIFQPISFGPIQFRVAEILCVLPMFTPAAIPGLFVGCFLGNFLAGAPFYDVLFGSIATLIGALGSYYFRRSTLRVVLPPILSNTIIVPWVLRLVYGETATIVYLMATIFLGEVVAIGVCGTLFIFLLKQYKKYLF